MSYNNHPETNEHFVFQLQMDDLKAPLEPVKTPKFYNKIQEIRKNFKKREQAVKLIQKVWRGYIVRKALNVKKNNIKEGQNEKQVASGVKHKSVDIAMNMINKAIYKYILKKRAIQEEFIKKYIRYAAVVIQRYYRGFKVRKACNTALRRTRKFQNFILAFLQGWKTRRIMQHNSIAYVIREIKELEKIKDSVRMKSCESDHNFWIDIPTRLHKKKCFLIEKFYQLYTTGLWVGTHVKLASGKDHLNIHYNPQPSQKNQRSKPISITEASLNLSVGNEDIISIKLKKEGNNSRMRQNSCSIVEKVSQINQESLNQALSERQRTPETRDYLRRNNARYDPRKSIEESKTRLRTLEKETSQSKSPDSKNKLFRESISPQSRSPRKKGSEDSTSTCSGNHLEKKKLIGTCKATETCKSNRPAKVGTEKETQMRNSRLGTTNSSFSRSLGRNEDKIENKTKKLRIDNMEANKKTHEDTANPKARICTAGSNEKSRWNSVQSRVSCWKSSNAKKMDQNVSQSMLKDLSLEALPVPSVSKSPLRLTKEHSQKDTISHKLINSSKTDKTKKPIIREERRLSKTSVNKKFEKTSESKNIKPTDNKGNTKERTLASFEDGSSSTIQASKSEKKELRSFSLSEARAQRRKDKSISMSQPTQADIITQFKGLDDSYDRKAI